MDGICFQPELLSCQDLIGERKMVVVYLLGERKIVGVYLLKVAWRYKIWQTHLAESKSDR